MEKIKTWDVFDTLIARRFINNDYVLRMIEQISKVPDFFENRKKFDNGARSLLEIYQEMAISGVIDEKDIDRFYKLEIELEKKHTFPIKWNLDQVNDGDLLISDMYLSAADILQLVRNCGLVPQVSIYQSNDKKRTGEIWDKVKDLGIELHVGDNLQSDIENAKARGINTEAFLDAAQFTGIENILIKNEFAFMAALIREVRIRTINKFEPDGWINGDKSISEISGQLNLPWLLVACELLHRKHGHKNLVFLGRDCQLLYKVYNSFYQTAYYLPFSRKVAYKQPEDSVGYLKSHIPPNALLVDISSTGATWEKICALHPFEIEVLIYSDQFHYSSEKPKLPETFSYLTQNSVIGQTNEVVEVFNCADHGVLDSIVNHNGVYLCKFGEPEMSSMIRWDIHDPINVAIEIAPFYGSQIAAELSRVSESDLRQLFAEFLMFMCKKTEVLSKLGDYMDNQNKYMSEVRDAQNS